MKHVLLRTIFFLAIPAISIAEFRKAPTPHVKNVFSHLPILETERLIIRPVEPDDVEDLFTIYADAEVLRFTSLQVRKTVEAVEKKVAWIFKCYKRGKPAPWAIELKKTNRVVGLCGFLDWVPRFACAEIMCMLARACWRQGIMTEASRAVIRYAFCEMGLNRIQSRIYSENIASLRLHQKLGFRVIGVIPEFGYYRGAYWDRVELSLLKSEFLAQKHLLEKGAEYQAKNALCLEKAVTNVV